VVTAQPAAAGSAAGVLAIILHAHPAVLAVSAAPGAVHDHGISGRESRGTGAQLLDPARVLMTEGERDHDWPFWCRPAHQVEVGVTGTRAPDFHKDLPWPGLRHRHIAKLGRRLPGDKLERSPARLLSRGPRRSRLGRVVVRGISGYAGTAADQPRAAGSA